MKRKFIISIASLGIAIASIIAVFLFSLQKTNVWHESETIYGNPAYAEGVTTSYKLTSANHLNWYLTYQFTKDSFVPAEKFKCYELSDIGGIGPWYYKEGSDDEESEVRPIGIYYNFNVNRLERQFSEELENEIFIDNRYEKEIYLKDLQDYYEPFITIGTDKLYTNVKTNANDISYSEQEEKFWNKFYAFFRIPVLEEEKIYLTASRIGSDGKVFCYLHNVDEPDTLPLHTQGVLADDALYFYISNKTAKGNIGDFSLVPGGYGIYMIPYNKENDTDFGYKDGVFDIDNLKTIFALEDSETVQYMGLSSGKSHLYLVIENGNSLVFKSLNLQNHKLDQEILIENDLGYFSYIRKKNFVVLETTGTGYEHLKVLYEKTEGVYELLIDSDVNRDVFSAENFLWHSYTPRVACDGKRLIACNFTNHSVNTPNYSWADMGTGLDVAVYEDNELKYFGRYSNSLDMCNAYSVFYDREWRGSYFASGEIDTYRFNIRSYETDIDISFNE